MLGRSFFDSHSNKGVLTRQGNVLYYTHSQLKSACEEYKKQLDNKNRKLLPALDAVIQACTPPEFHRHLLTEYQKIEYGNLYLWSDQGIMTCRVRNLDDEVVDVRIPALNHLISTKGSFNIDKVNKELVINKLVRENQIRLTSSEEEVGQACSELLDTIDNIRKVAPPHVKRMDWFSKQKSLCTVLANCTNNSAFMHSLSRFAGMSKQTPSVELTS